MTMWIHSRAGQNEVCIRDTDLPETSLTSLAHLS